MDPAVLSQLAQQATEILVPALSALYIATKPVIGKGKEVFVDMIYEKTFEKLGSAGGKRAKALLEKISPKMSESLEKSLIRVFENSEDPKAKEELQKEILKLLRGNPDLAREIEIIVNINLNIDLVKQIVFGNSNLILNLEGLEGKELIKVMEYLDWKRKETIKEELSKNYSPSSIPQYNEDHIKFVTLSRAEEISRVLKCLQKNKILLFGGIAGVGKTTLARVFLEFRPANVPEPFWFSFQHNQEVNLEVMLEELSGYLQAPDILSFKGIRKAGIIDINRLTDELMKRKPVWLVFDDLSYITDIQRKFKDPDMGLLFLALRDNNHRAKIILTSRVFPIMNNGERLIDELEDENKEDLKGLETSFAIDYLKAEGLEKIEYNTLKSLSESVDGHPFSLKLLIGLAKRHSLENILKEPSIYKKSKEERIKNAKFLFDKLAGNEKELLERISVFRKPETLEAINKMLTDDVPINSVDTLLDKSLLETDHIGNYWLHPLVQEFSYEDLKNKKEAHMLAVKYYLSLPLPENLSKKEDVQPLIEAHYHTCAAKEYDAAAEIIFHFKLYEMLERWGNYNTLIELYEGVLPKSHFEDESLLKNEELHRAILGNLGNVYTVLNEGKKAIQYHEKVIELNMGSGDNFNKIISFSNIGFVYFQQGMMKKAIECFEQSIKISNPDNQKNIIGANLGNIGLVYLQIGETKKAIQYFEKSLPLLKEANDKRREGANLGHMSIAYLQLDEAKKAVQCIQRSMNIAKEINDKRSIGNCFGNKGLIHSFFGEMKEALESYEQALSVAKEIDDRYNFGNWLGNIGSVYFYSGEIEKAIEYYKQALKIAKEINDVVREELWIDNLAQALSCQGEFKKAIEYYEQALKISREIENRSAEGNILKNLGLSYCHLGEPRKAIELLNESLAIGKSIEDPRMIGFCEQKLKELEGSDD